MFVVVTELDESKPDFKVFTALGAANALANQSHNKGDCVVTIYSVAEDTDVRKAKWLVESQDCELIKTLPRKLSAKEQQIEQQRPLMRELGIEP